MDQAGRDLSAAIAVTRFGLGGLAKVAGSPSPWGWSGAPLTLSSSRTAPARLASAVWSGAW